MSSLRASVRELNQKGYEFDAAGQVHLQEKHALSEQVAQRQEQLQVAGDRIRALEAKLANTQRTIGELNESITQATAQQAARELQSSEAYSKLASELMALKGANTTIRMGSSDLQASYSSLAEKCRELERELEREKQDRLASSDKLAHSQEQLKRAESKCAALGRELEQSQEAIAEWKSTKAGHALQDREQAGTTLLRVHFTQC